MIEKFWDMFFFWGAIFGGLHNPMLEAGKDFQQRITMYAIMTLVGWLSFMFAGRQCELGNCQSHPVWVGSYMLGAFLMGAGGTGVTVNFTHRGSKDDPDMHMYQQMSQGNHYSNSNQQGVAMQPSPAMHASADNYEPVTMPSGPMM